VQQVVCVCVRLCVVVSEGNQLTAGRELFVFYESISPYFQYTLIKIFKIL
jgi:hypothetical protein